MKSMSRVMSKVMLLCLMVSPVFVNASEEQEGRKSACSRAWNRTCKILGFPVVLVLTVFSVSQGNHLIDKAFRPSVISCDIEKKPIMFQLTGQFDTSTKTPKVTCNVGPKRVRFYMGQEPCNFGPVLSLLPADQNVAGGDFCYAQNGNRAMLLPPLTPEILDRINKLAEEKKSKKNN